MRTPYKHGYEDALDRGWNASGKANGPGAYEYSKGYAAGQLKLTKETSMEDHIRTLEAELTQARADARVLALCVL